MTENNLTDSQLRRKLIDLGLDVGPITDSTRKLYEKKLSELISGNKNDSQKNRRRSAPLHPVQKKITNSLIGFSSEDSDLDVHGDPDSRRRRRRTMPPSEIGTSIVNKNTGPVPIPSTSQTEDFKTPLPKKSIPETSFSSSAKRSSLRSSKRVNLNHTSFDLESSDSEFDLGKRLDVRKRRSLGSYTPEPTKTSSFDLSDISALPNIPLKSRHRTMTDIPQTPTSSTFMQANGQRKTIKDDDQNLEWEFSSEEERMSGLQHVPHLLLALVAIFFVIVGLLYVGVRQTDQGGSSLTTNGLLAGKALPPFI